MLTLGSARCSANLKFATYSVLTYFHADTRLPEACFLHAWPLLGWMRPGSNSISSLAGYTQNAVRAALTNPPSIASKTQSDSLVPTERTGSSWLKTGDLGKMWYTGWQSESALMGQRKGAQGASAAALPTGRSMSVTRMGVLQHGMHTACQHTRAASCLCEADGSVQTVKFCENLY